MGRGFTGIKMMFLSTGHQATDPSSRISSASSSFVQPQPYLGSSIILVTHQLGGALEISKVWSAPGHLPHALSTSSFRDCSDNSWHCPQLENPIRWGLISSSFRQVRQRSSPCLGEGRCCMQPVHTKISLGNLWLCPRRQLRSLLTAAGGHNAPCQALSSTAKGRRFFQPSSPALAKQVVQLSCLCKQGPAGAAHVSTRCSLQTAPAWGHP